MTNDSTTRNDVIQNTIDWNIEVRQRHLAMANNAKSGESRDFHNRQARRMTRNIESLNAQL